MLWARNFTHHAQPIGFFDMKTKGNPEDGTKAIFLYPEAGLAAAQPEKNNHNCLRASNMQSLRGPSARYAAKNLVALCSQLGYTG